MNNLEGKSNSIDVRKLEDFNNFYCYLPGGLYRSSDYLNPRRKKIINDLDKVATKLGINTTALYIEMDKELREVMRAVKMVREKGGETEEAIKIGEGGEKIKQEVHKKLIPLFEEMVKLGYDPIELMS